MNDCPWLQSCGGCDLGTTALGEQHQRKQHFVQRALNRDALPPLVNSPLSVGHRARIKLAIEDDQVGYRAGGSHDLVPIERCVVARDEVNEALTALRSWLPGRGSRLASVEIRSDGTRAVFNFQLKGKAIGAKARSAMWDLGDVALGGRRLCGDPTLQLNVLDCDLRASPNSFYQVNLEANVELVRHVRDTVASLSPARVLDLYSGIGNLTFPIADLGVPVLAVEREGQATGDCQERIGERDVKVLRMPVERMDPSREFFDVAVLDPPRKGASGVLAKLVLNRPRALVYISCHAPSAARDIKEATRAGYSIADVTCFDMFPDTHHVETVIVLHRA